MLLSCSFETLEQYFTAKINEEKQLTKIGGWWDRKGENEIDIIAINDFDKTCEVYEVKRQASKINMAKLSEKVETFKTIVKSEINDYGMRISGLSMEDM